MRQHKFKIYKTKIVFFKWITKNIKVDKKAYDKYRFRYLQNSDPNLSNKFNSDIIDDAIKNNSDFKK